MRTLGVAVLGIFAGLAVGFTVFSELLGRLVVDNGVAEAPWTFVIGFGPQLTAVAGGIVAVVIDNRVRRRQERQ
ncbi:DUF5957 family protein [Saccharomonospora piscinae]|uniref:DUF5957 family protein n=1 Tax=Saccharomonospora piscinae TaxID=687388 RepID=UPI000463D805|nr:DUF5957 family protein [Saccharomonospora piscinae]